MLLPRDLMHAILAFGAMLRSRSISATTDALMLSVRALELVDVVDRGAVYLALRTILVSRVEEQPIFDRCFDEFWRFDANRALHFEQVFGSELKASDPAEPPSLDNIASERSDLAVTSLEEGEVSGAERLDVPGESNAEILTEQDFSTFGTEQLEEIAQLTAQIAKRLSRRLKRRRKPSRRRGAVDLRRSIRTNLMRSEIIELRRRSRRRRKLKLVLLCDVSGSMDLYSRFLLQFLYALQNVFGRVETFTFATRLTRVSELLRGPSYQIALKSLTGVRDWSGGTRIGESLREFNESWARLLDHRTIVVLLSDGWDTGNPDLLAQEMLALKRRAGRVIWLNPLLGNPIYEPITRGMAAALPLVHTFAPAHNLDSLRMLARHLNLR
jgi:uncharacterized protein